MPLLKGKENIGRNIKTEVTRGKSRKQAIAIAMDVARRRSGIMENMSKDKKEKQEPEIKKAGGKKKMPMSVKDMKMEAMKKKMKDYS